MEEVVTEAGRPFFRLFYYIFRGLLWLAWDLSIEIIGWTIGWIILRMVTIGKYPQFQLSEQDKVPLWQALSIEFLGVSALGLTVVTFYSLAFQ